MINGRTLIFFILPFSPFYSIQKDHDQFRPILSEVKGQSSNEQTEGQVDGDLLHVSPCSVLGKL